MPDIDPAALSRQDSAPGRNGSNTPSMSSKTLSLNTGTQKGGKVVQSAPRVDLEPLYTGLKGAIGEHWVTYKEALSRFFVGELNQDELNRQIDHFISTDITRDRLHNQLLCGIYANVWRDTPENSVANWVSANDKPTGVTKAMAGDAIEQRLKAEIMQLPPRVRHRFKSIQDDPMLPLTHAILTTRAAKRYSGTTSANATTSTNALPNSHSTSTVSSPTPAPSGLNKDVEIRKRYNQLLISETRDLPTTTALIDRVLPTCYEEGIPSGPANPAVCADLISTALEVFTKEAISNILGRTRVNAPISAPDGSSLLALGSTSATTSQNGTSGVAISSNLNGNLGPQTTNTPGILTSSYKRQLAREEAAFARNEIKRSEIGLLPCETEAARQQNWGRGLPGDLRIAWELGGPLLKNVVPWLGEKIVLSDIGSGGREDNEDELEDADGDIIMNGHGSNVVNGNGIDATSMDVGANLEVNPTRYDYGAAAAAAASTYEAEWNWQGATRVDRVQLSSILDDCLALGQ